MTEFEYRLAYKTARTNGRFRIEHELGVDKDGNDCEWSSLEDVLLWMNDPMKYEKMTFRIDRRVKK